MVITVRCSCTVKVDTVLVACRCFIKSVRFGYIRTRHTVRSYAETKARSTFVHSIRSLKRAAYVHTYLYCTAANVRCSRYYILRQYVRIRDLQYDVYVLENCCQRQSTTTVGFLLASQAQDWLRRTNTLSILECTRKSSAQVDLLR